MRALIIKEPEWQWWARHSEVPDEDFVHAVHGALRDRPLGSAARVGPIGSDTSELDHIVWEREWMRTTSGIDERESRAQPLDP